MVRPTIFIIALLISTPAVAGPVCPKPQPNLRAGSPDVEAQTVSFHNQDKSYTLDIYSAYSAQLQTPLSPWCIRYEVENTGQYDIEKFSLPAGPLQEDLLPARKRDAVVVTRSSGNKPGVTDIVVYAFKSVAMRTRAYTALQANPVLSGQFAAATYNSAEFSRRVFDFADAQTVTVASEVSGSKLAEHILVKEPMELPLVGMDFTGGSNSNVSAGSRVSFDGKSFTINVVIEIEGPIKGIEAPYFTLLSKVKLPDELLYYARQPQYLTGPLPIGAPLSVTRNFPLETMPLRLMYLIDQPIILTLPDRGRVCILAPAYSPIPIPSSAFSCNLFQ